MIDSHAHVDSRKFDSDRDAVLSRLWEAGLSAFVNIGCDVATSQNSIALAESDPRIFATVGIHPHDAGRATDDDWAAIQQLARHDRVVAIGECGLDRGPHNDAPFAAQEALLRRHVALARATDLPLVIHNRDTYPDLFRILADEIERDGPLRGIMHCFSGGPDEAARSIELGFDLSFSGVVTFKNAGPVREAAALAPLENILVETDCPYLTPAPHRGKRNEPAYVVHTSRFLAELRGLDASAFERIADTNTVRAFGLPTELIA